jgi:hypothetical protein
MAALRGPKAITALTILREHTPLYFDCALKCLAP